MSAAPDNAALRWHTYSHWACINLLVFGVLYPLVNWLTGLRAATFSLYLDSEKSIPFLPAWIWIYLSVNLLFMLPPLFMRESDMPLLGKRVLAATISGCMIFLLLPAHLGFERVVPHDEVYRLVFFGLFQADGPYNVVPSLHVTYASQCIHSLQTTAHSWPARAAWRVWLASIMASTVLVHQHHLLDVASGLLLAVVISHWIPAT